MWKTIPAIMVGLLLACPVRAEEGSGGSGPIPPEVTTEVVLSSTDVNRIVCPGEITDLIFSKEKGVEGHFANNNAFLKFTITVDGEEKRYTNTSSEFFVSCNGAIYSLIATPKRIPSVTLRLAPSASSGLKQNVDHLQGLPFEKKVLQLVREAYRDEYPDSYRIAPVNGEFTISAELTAKLKRVVEAEGTGLRLKEYWASATGAKAVRVSERDFLRPGVGEKIVAVAVENKDLEPGGSSRVFIVEQRGGTL